MKDPYALDDLLYLMRRLRDPASGCPWDIQQNYRSITPSTIEEAYEVVDAIEQNDFGQLRDELGDLLFQVVFYTQLAQEEGRFTFADVVDGLTQKLVRRHPHVFPEGTLQSIADPNNLDSQHIKQRWEEIKQQERTAKGLSGILADVPVGLPAFARAQKLQKRAASVAFDFKNVEEVFSRLKEEMIEMQDAMASTDKDAMEDEMGDVLFSLVNLCRHLHIDGEKSLRRANQKFTARFNWIEAHLREQGSDWSSQTPDSLEDLWQLAKKSTK